jgi:guanine nucleotide-binding protein subunit alpha
MIIIHDNGFSEDERLAYREIVFSNTIESMKAIINAIQKFKVGTPSNEFQSSYDLINDLPEPIECGYDIPTDISVAIQKLWSNDIIKQMYERRNEYQLKDSAA